MAPTWITNLLQYAIIILSWVIGPLTDLEIYSPPSCLRSAPNLEALVTCLDTFTVPHDYYAVMTYDLAQPVGTQREDWKLVIQSLLSSEGNCGLTRVPLSLRGLYTIEPFQDFCVLYETASRCGTYLKGWGFFIVPFPRQRVLRNIHISAPHPGYDLGTVVQAAAVFEATGARSLLVPGRTRTAFLSHSECIVPTSPKQDYYRTDPAHNDQEPFFDANVAIYDWQHAQLDGCPSSSCAFLQFHGKGSSTCPSDDIFLSSGLGNSAASQSWYTDSIDRPVKRLHQNLQRALPPFWKISLPSSSMCPLTATKNVVGRHLNGIHLPQVCSRAANSKSATGEFVHAEQASKARKKEWYSAWVKAIEESFEVPCDAVEVDRQIRLCVRPAAADGEVPATIGMEGGRGVGGLNPHRNRWYMLMSYLMVV